MDPGVFCLQVLYEKADRNAKLENTAALRPSHCGSGESSLLWMLTSAPTLTAAL